MEQLSPAREVLDAISLTPIDPIAGHRDVDPEYAAHLARSYESMLKLEAWQDLIGRLKAYEETLVDEWGRGLKGAENNNKTVLLLRVIPKIPKFALKRWDEIQKVRERTVSNV